MKHLFISTALSFISILSFGQSFHEVKIDGNLNDYLALIKQKGYVLKENNISKNNAVLKNDNTELYVFCTPKTKKVYKVTIYTPKNDNWYGLKAEYQKYQTLLTNKYGEPKPDNVFSFFSNPYYEGDGYEMSALSLGKVNYFTFWDLSGEQNLNIVLEMSKYSQIRISYENSNNSKLMNKEKEEIENKIF